MNYCTNDCIDSYREQEESNKKALQKSKRLSASPNKAPSSPVKLSPIKAQSNRVLIKNALQHVCLAGPMNNMVKGEVIKVNQSLYANSFI